MAKPVTETAYRSLPSAQLIEELRSVPHTCRYVFPPGPDQRMATALEFRRPGAKAPFAAILYGSDTTVRRYEEETV